MLPSLDFEGTIKVRNKGVEISLLADRETVDMAFQATRTLVVCGMSTAVLEVTELEPLDTRTLAYYEQTTSCLIALTPAIYQAVSRYKQPETDLRLFEGSDASDVIREVREILKYKK